MRPLVNRRGVGNCIYRCINVCVLIDHRCDPSNPKQKLTSCLLQEQAIWMKFEGNLGGGGGGGICVTCGCGHGHFYFNPSSVLTFRPFSVFQ